MSYDPLDLKGQAAAREKQALRDKLARDTEAADTKWLMSSQRGRRIVWRLLSRAGVFRSSFNTNAMQMAFAEGNRNYGLGMLDAIQRLVPEQYPVMLAENAPKEEAHDD